MNLEPRHLAPFFPYGLEIAIAHRPETEVITSLEPLRINRIYKYSDIMPLFRPLSDLLEETAGYCYKIEDIVHNCAQHCDAYDEWLESYIDNPEGSRILQAPYEILEELFNQHYDVFDLLSIGLANICPKKTT